MNEKNKTLAHWLFFCCGMIFTLVIVGAITRLTESGLSIADWHAVKDMLPPVSHAQWELQFMLYKQTPEFQKINHAFTLEEFKNIYFWEWLHRLLARAVGLVYALPLAYFWVRGKILPRLKMRLVLFLGLGGLQGFIGWFMVKSGLVNEPRVSHFRLALHLSMALLLLGCLWVTALGLFKPSFKITASPRFKKHAVAAFGLLCITIIWGAFVAGLDAGMIYNEFPLMGGRIIPGDLFFLNPWWDNFLHHATGVQFLHRILGILTFVTVFSLGLVCFWSKNTTLKKIGITLCGLIALQLTLGIATLLSVVAIPLAAAHQAGAVLNLLALSTLLFALRRAE